MFVGELENGRWGVYRRMGDRMGVGWDTARSRVMSAVRRGRLVRPHVARRHYRYLAACDTPAGSAYGTIAHPAQIPGGPFPTAQPQPSRHPPHHHHNAAQHNPAAKTNHQPPNANRTPRSADRYHPPPFFYEGAPNHHQAGRTRVPDTYLRRGSTLLFGVE